MAASKSQRVAAFLLALMFLLTTVGAAAYVIIEINQGEGGLITDPSTQDQQPEQAEAPVQEDTAPTQQLADFTGPVEIPELRFEDTVEGTGDVVLAGQTVTIHYTGALASDGTVFDSSVGGEPAQFPLDNLIQGWQEGIPGMKVGGKRRLFIPASLGYGEAGSGASIPPNSDLVFDIELFATE